MSLVTVDRYQLITGDTVSAATAVTGALLDAQALLEEELQRDLDQRERTERVYPQADGRVWPKVTPIISTVDDLRADGDSLYATSPFGAPPFIDPTGFLDLTYTGGYLERTANPDAPNRLPEHVERDLAFAAYLLMHPTLPAPGTAGATSVSQGDAAITFGADGPPAGTDGQVSSCWSKATLRLGRKRRRI